ncbi:MAG: hypothetical protein K1Y36_19820 [Blastocatellia bacterium]|nr:hypothetical protein [Blastocatellia bacterium]
MRSFYVLEFSVTPGTVRRFELWALNDIQKIRQRLEEEFRTNQGVWLAVVHDESICLTTYQHGINVQTFSLLPFFTFQIPGYAEITIDEEGTVEGYSRRADDLLPTGDQLSHRLVNEAVDGIRVEIDWDSMPILPLDGDFLHPGEKFDIPYECERYGGMTVYYGLNDHEAGIYGYYDEDGNWIETEFEEE